MGRLRKRKPVDLDFQMSFYEGILKARPDFVEALMALGDIYTKKGFYEKGLEIDRRLSLLKPDNPIIHYNLACSLSLLGDITSSFKALKRALALGYDDFAFIHKDPDLVNLRCDERFRTFFQKFEKGFLDNIRR